MNQERRYSGGRTLQLRVENPEWSGCDAFLILRAMQYAAEFHQVTECLLSCPKPPVQVLKAWKLSLDRKKRVLNIRDSCTMEECPKFSAPDYLMLLDGQEILKLGIPDIPGLTDFHVHTELAYCSENMAVERALELEWASGVKLVNFAEHSGQLYCTPEIYWNNRFIWSKRDPVACRMQRYRELARNSAGMGRTFGLELDVDEEGHVSDVPGISGWRIGAIHFLGEKLSYEEKKTDFMRRLDALLNSRIDILAHPFRVFPKSGLPVPEELFELVAEKLVRAHVAAEINFHANRPQPEFVKLVLKKGGKISFGTDSHNLYEAGYLKPHYEFCRELGIAGKLDEILLNGKRGK